MIKSYRNQQTQVEHPVIQLCVLCLGQHDIPHEQEAVDHGSGHDAQKLQQNQRQDKGNRQQTKDFTR